MGKKSKPARPEKRPRDHEDDEFEPEDKEAKQVRARDPLTARMPLFAEASLTCVVQAKIEEEQKQIPQTDSRGWVNKQRTLVFCSRGVSYRARHLMLDVCGCLEI